MTHRKINAGIGRNSNAQISKALMFPSRCLHTRRQTTHLLGNVKSSCLLSRHFWLCVIGCDHKIERNTKQKPCTMQRKQRQEPIAQPTTPLWLRRKLYVLRSALDPNDCLTSYVSSVWYWCPKTSDHFWLWPAPMIMFIGTRHCLVSGYEELITHKITALYFLNFVIS